jgi:hypothetical protein
LISSLPGGKFGLRRPDARVTRERRKTD